MKNWQLILRLALKVARLFIKDRYYYVKYLITRISLKMPWNDNKIFLIDTSGEGRQTTLVFAPDDTCETILEFYAEVLQQQKFHPYDENHEKLVEKFSRSRLSLVLEGKFYDE